MDYVTLNVDSADAVRELFTRVFTESESKDEGEMVGRLAFELVKETPQDDIYVFAATESGSLLGCIVFSRMTFDTSDVVFILSPVAVDTKTQGQGLGQKLISHGLAKLKADGVEVVMTYGDPNFYSKVGFEPVSVTTIAAPFELQHPHGWIGQSLTESPLQKIAGTPTCVPALQNPDYW